jgi:hypothetical protein
MTKFIIILLVYPAKKWYNIHKITEDIFYGWRITLDEVKFKSR